MNVTARTTVLQRTLQVGVLVAAFGTAGILFWGMPAGSAALPDPQAMAAVGDGRQSSAANVEFWTTRVAALPTSATYRANLASAQLALAGDTGDLAGYEVAERTAASAVALDPDDQGALLALAASRSGQHDFSGALDLAEQVLASNADSAGALLSAGDALLELGDYTGARGRYDQATALVTPVPSILSRYARLESLVGSLDEATTLAHRALTDAGSVDLRHADAAFYWFQLASFEFASGDAAGARAHLDSALSIEPGHRGSTELLAKVRSALGDEDGAIALYERLVTDGSAADLHGELAKLYERAGRTAEANEQVQLGLAVADAVADRFPAERRHLIGFLADHDPQEALRLATLDLAERQDVHSHAWYAWSLLQAGDAERAAAAIRPALAYGTQDAWLLYQAGSIEAAVGDAVAARSHLEAALELNPHFDLVHADTARALLVDL